MSLTQDLKNILAGEVDDSESSREAVSRDASLFSSTPAVVVFPRDVKDISALVRFASRSQHSLTVRSGGSDMSGGPLGRDIVAAMPKHFNHIGEVENHAVTIEPGVWYRDLEAALAPKNLLLPTYPASKDICTVGGMVANNAAGEKTLAYGKTADYVQVLQAVLSDGNEYTFEALNRSELNAKLTQRDFEGEIYQRLFKLLQDNYDLIQAARPKVSKNSAGYALWDIWNRDRRMFDLTRLLCGSQGTLGIITRITFKVVVPKPHARLMVIFLDNLEPLADIVPVTLRYQPESFECYDDHTLRLARTIKNRLFHLRGLPKLTLLAEFTGYDTNEVTLRLRAAQAALRQFPVRTQLVLSTAQVANYWYIRRESFNLLRHNAKAHQHTAPFIDDIIVRPEYLPAFLPRLSKIMDAYQLTYTIAGHIGDGNFHIIPLMDARSHDFLKTIEEVSDKVCDLVLEYKGSLTAEHNDGLIRGHYLKKMFGEEVYNLFVEVKKIFDPNNIFNPGKKIGADWNEAKKYLVRS